MKRAFLLLGKSGKIEIIIVGNLYKVLGKIPSTLYVTKFSDGAPQSSILEPDTFLIYIKGIIAIIFYTI